MAYREIIFSLGVNAITFVLLRNVNDTERVVCVGRREDNSRRDKTRYTNATLMNVNVVVLTPKDAEYLQV